MKSVNFLTFYEPSEFHNLEPVRVVLCTRKVSRLRRSLSLSLPLCLSAGLSLSLASRALPFAFSSINLVLAIPPAPFLSKEKTAVQVLRL